MSKNTAKSLTTKFDKFESDRLSFTPLEDNERSKGQKIAYPRYNHPTFGEDQPCFIQGPWMTMSHYGVPQLGEYYKEDKDRAFVKCPLDMTDENIVKMVEELQKVDEKYSSESFKKESFGKHAKKYTYQPIIRQPVSDEDDEVTRPAYMKLKLDLTWPECNVKTEVIKSELLENGKRAREPIQVETVGDFASNVNYLCKFRPIFRPVKMWAHQQKMKDPQYGIVFKLIKVEVEPNKTGNSLYQNYRQEDVWIDDEEDENEEKEAVQVKKESKNAKKTVKKPAVVDDSESSEESESSDDSDSDSDSEPVQKVVKKKGKAKKSA